MAKTFEVPSLRELHSLASAVRLNSYEGKFHYPLLSFSAFLRFRLAELQLWPRELQVLKLIVGNGTKKPYFRPGHDGRPNKKYVDYTIATPKLRSGSDEAIISAVSDACSEAFAEFVPGANLQVLADEFLDAGGCARFSCRASHRTTAARVELSLGMRWIEATLDVTSTKTTKRYAVSKLRVTAHWLNLFGSLAVSSRRVLIRAMPSTSTIVSGPNRWDVYPNGVGSQARRFVVDVDPTGRQRLIQNWELTGRGGLPEPGTSFIEPPPPSRFDALRQRLLSGK